MTNDNQPGARLIAEALLAQGVERVYLVPGESFLPLLDALYDLQGRIRVITCRHEHGAICMAEAEAKLTGRPGVCLVTRGPGACNASIGVHIAFQDSTPLILLVGQVPRSHLGREAFQEVDFRRFFGPLAKSAEQAERADRLPEAMARAFRLALSGRQGPAVLALPEDMLREPAPPEVAPRIDPDGPYPGPEAMERLRALLAKAERPVMLIGGGGWTDAARANLLAFAAQANLPTACGFRRNDILDNFHPCYIGELGYDADPELVARVRSADVILAVGTRMGQVISQGYTLIDPARHTLVQVHPEAAEFGKVFPPHLAIQAGMAEFAQAAARLPGLDGRRWESWAAEGRRSHDRHRSPPQPARQPLDMAQVMAWLDERLPKDAIVTVDAGNFTFWPQRFIRFGGGRRLLGPVNGAMGYGVPAAIAAKLAAPERLVVGVCGDGGFGMTGIELATAMQSGAAMVVLVMDNGMYGTVRMHQERGYPGRSIGTDLTSPDFAALARAHGAHAETVAVTADFAPAFERCVDSGRPALIHLKTDPEAITPRTTLTAVRDAGRLGTAQ
ncbi:MAG: thiamine pyrophosphate-binding protein [Magnetospirillum sp. WYHS-4]